MNRTTSRSAAKLDRATEITSAMTAMVIDDALRHREHGAVDVAAVMSVTRVEAHDATRLMARLAPDLPAARESRAACSHRAVMHGARHPRSGAVRQVRQRERGSRMLDA